MALFCVAIRRDSVFLLKSIIIIIILLIWEFFAPVLADGFPLDSEWQQVSSSLQDISQYSGRSQHCYSLHGLQSTSYFQVLQSLQGLRTYLSFHLLSVLPYNQPYNQSPLFGRFSFFFLFFFFFSLFCWLSLGVVVCPRLGDPFVSQNPKDFYASHFLERILRLLLLLLFTSLEFFTSVLTDDFPLEFEWQQVSSSLQDSSPDSGRS